MRQARVPIASPIEKKRPPVIGGRFSTTVRPLGSPQTLGGIVNVTVCPGWIESELLIGAAFEPIGSIRKRTVFAGPTM